MATRTKEDYAAFREAIQKSRWKFMKIGKRDKPIPWFYYEPNQWGLGITFMWTQSYRGVKLRFLCFLSALGWYK
jgi:hypothetical protein